MESHEPKWKRLPDERPDQILRAALEVFSDKGFRAATMDEVASAAGIAKGTIYLYFASKEDLFLALARQVLQHALDLLPEIRLDNEADPETFTRRLGREFLGVLMTPEVAKVLPLIVAEYNHLPALQELYRTEILQKVNLQLASILEMGMELGWVRRLDPVIASRCLLGMFFVFVMTQEVFGAKTVTPMDADDIADTVTTIYFHGILERKETP